MLSQISTAADAYTRGFSYLGRAGIARYLLLPIAINILLLTAIVLLAFYYASPLVEYLSAAFAVDSDGSLLDYLRPLVTVVLTGLVILAYLLVYKYLVLTLVSPFLALLSEKVEQELTGQEYPFSWGQLLRDLGRAAIINFRNFSLELLATIVFAILTFVPLIGLLSPIALLMVQSYFYGFALMDFNAERHRLNRRATETWMRRHFWAVTSHGLIFHFIFIIPLVGWFFFFILATIAGTITWLELKNNSPSVMT